MLSEQRPNVDIGEKAKSLMKAPMLGEPMGPLYDPVCGVDDHKNTFATRALTR
jgi:hypothetical protein